MDEFGTAAGWALRLLGAFYALSAGFGLRRHAIDMLLTQALSALAMPDPRETAAGTRRAWFLSTQLLVVGVAGIALMALLDLALPLFVVSAALYALYVVVLAPRFFDPFDPPEEAGRSQTRRAFWIYLTVTVLIVAAGWGGLLRPWREEAWPVLAIAGLLAAGLVAYGIRLMWRMQVVPGAPRFDSSDHQLTLPDGQEEFQARLRETPLTLSPSWDDGALFDATTREAVAGPLPPDMVTQEDWELIAHWLGLIRDVMDPSDPERRGFRVHDGAARMEAEGRPLFERLAARMAPGQLRFEPVPWPRLSRYDVTAVKLMCDAGTDPLWGSRDGFHESMDAHLFGLSWSLAIDLGVWRMDFDNSVDWDDPGGAPRWTAAEAAAHEAEGRVLAMRLVGELAATGRNHVRVSFWSAAEGRAIPIQGA